MVLCEHLPWFGQTVVLVAMFDRGLVKQQHRVSLRVQAYVAPGVGATGPA